MANATQAISAEAGIVTIQASTMLAPTPQRTADSLRLAPTPITDPVITCVVLTGRPIRVAAWMTLAPINCADMPVAGSGLRLVQPTERQKRQARAQVPNAIGRADSPTTQSGTRSLGRRAGA